MIENPYVVAIGGTTRPNSSTEKALRCVARHLASRGIGVEVFSGFDLDIPMYQPGSEGREPRAAAIVDAVRRADGVIIGSPGYHGGVSGLVKNILDYIEDLSRDARPYLDGRVVGCIGTGAGWQGAGATLAALRTIVHALRGWNTPMGVIVNTAQPSFDEAGAPIDPKLDQQLKMMAAQIAHFLRRPEGGAQTDLASVT